jgi:hypothetical protein
VDRVGGCWGGDRVDPANTPDMMEGPGAADRDASRSSSLSLPRLALTVVPAWVRMTVKCKGFHAGTGGGQVGGVSQPPRQGPRANCFPLLLAHTHLVGDELMVV